MQIIGRENSVPHWCVWCDINMRKFDFKNYPCVNLWTFESMKTGPARLGIYSKPLFTFRQPSNFLPSVVHEKINTRNDIIACLYKFTDRRVEMIRREESDARAETLAAEVSFISIAEARDSRSERNECNGGTGLGGAETVRRR
jgi:hypothetical protein